MSDLKINLAREDGRFRPGEVIQGKLAWRFARSPQAIRLRLCWQTSGKASARDQQPVAGLDIAGPGVSGVRAFSFRLPYGPWSFKGRAISLRWFLEALAEGADAGVCVRDLEVSHLRRTLDLEPQDAGARA